MVFQLNFAEYMEVTSYLSIRMSVNLIFCFVGSIMAGPNCFYYLTSVLSRVMVAQ